MLLIVFFIIGAFDLLTDLIIGTIFLFSNRAARAFCDRVMCMHAKLHFEIYKALGVMKGQLIFSVDREKLPDTFIAVANHQTFLDIVALTILLWPHRPRFIAKNTLKTRTPVTRAYLTSQRSAGIDREVTSREDMRIIQKKIQRMTNKTNFSQKTCFIVFPEGTRSRTENILPFKTGAIRMLINHLPGIPIVSVAITGGSSIGKLKGLLKRNPDNHYTAQAIDLHTVPTKKKECNIFLEELEKEINQAKQKLDSETKTKRLA